VIPVTTLVSSEGTVSLEIKGRKYLKSDQEFSRIDKPIIFWNITSRCNLRCKHCYIGNYNKDLNTCSLLNIALKIKYLNPSLIIITGGEPLIRDDIFRIIKTLSLEKFKIALSSNGTLINEHIADFLKKSNICYVGISIESIVPELHDEFRGVSGSWMKAIHGIEVLKRYDIAVGIRTTLTRQNIENALDVVKLCIKHNVKRLAYYYLVPSGRGLDIVDLLPTAEQHIAFLEKIMKIAKMYSKEVEILTVDNPSDGIYLALRTSENEDEFYEKLKFVGRVGTCSAGRKVLSIYPDGEVYPCQFLNNVSMGNALRDDLLKIWHEPKEPIVSRFREAFTKGKYLCSNCIFVSYCGGCRVRAQVLTGDILGLDPHCALIHAKLVKHHLDLKSWQWKIINEVTSKLQFSFQGVSS